MSNCAAEQNRKERKRKGRKKQQREIPIPNSVNHYLRSGTNGRYYWDNINNLQIPVNSEGNSRDLNNLQGRINSVETSLKELCERLIIINNDTQRINTGIENLSTKVNGASDITVDILNINCVSVPYIEEISCLRFVSIDTSGNLIIAENEKDVLGITTSVEDDHCIVVYGGIVEVFDDGACQVGDKCTCIDGIAVPIDYNTQCRGWFVMRRIDENTIRVLL